MLLAARRRPDRLPGIHAKTQLTSSAAGATRSDIQHSNNGAPASGMNELASDIRAGSPRRWPSPRKNSYLIRVRRRWIRTIRMTRSEEHTSELQSLRHL